MASRLKLPLLWQEGKVFFHSVSLFPSAYALLGLDQLTSSYITTRLHFPAVHVLPSPPTTFTHHPLLIH